MKKLPVLLNTPAKAVMAVVLFILLGEFLVMVLFEGAYNALPKDTFLKGVAFEFIDPVLLTLLVSPALYFLIFKPMNEQQAELKNAQKKSGRHFRNGRPRWMLWTIRFSCMTKVSASCVATRLISDVPEFRSMKSLAVTSLTV